MEEFAVAFKRAQVVPIRPQADVAVRTHHQQCGALDAEEIGSEGFEAYDWVGRLGLGAEGDGRFEERRVGGVFPQSGVKLHERRTVCGSAAREHEGMSGAVGKLMKSTELLVRPLHLDHIG